MEMNVSNGSPTGNSQAMQQSSRGYAEDLDSSLTESATESKPTESNLTKIIWPDAYHPDHSAVFVTNEIVIDAPAEAIWHVLIRAGEWPDWFSRAAHVHFVSHAGPDLRDRSRFRWNAYGTRITSKILEFEAGRRLAWQAHGFGVDAYHAWLLTPLTGVDTGKTHVLTEETQNGWSARLVRKIAPDRMRRKHLQWLQDLKRRVESTP